MLKDLERLIDGQSSDREAAYIRRRNLEEEDFMAAAQYLLQRQFIYRSDRGSTEYFDLISRFRRYFENLFAAMGYQLELDTHVHLVGLIPKFEAGRQVWKMDETILLLVLRLAHHEGIQDAQVDDNGAVFVMSEDILSKYETLTQKTRPAFGRLKDILAEFRRRGIVSYDQFEEKETIITIRPAINVIMGGDFMARLTAFNETENSPGNPGKSQVGIIEVKNDERTNSEQETSDV